MTNRSIDLPATNTFGFRTTTGFKSQLKYLPTNNNQPFIPALCLLTHNFTFFIGGSFCGATDTRFWTFGDVSSVFKARVGSLICTWQRHRWYTFPKIHLLAASIAAKLFSLTYLPLLGLETGIYGTTVLQCETRQMLY